MSEAGHNSGVSGQRIKAFVDRVEKLEDNISMNRADIKDIYAEAKSTGFNAKVIRKLVALRKQPADKRREEQELLELYDSAAQLGLFG